MDCLGKSIGFDVAKAIEPVRGRSALALCFESMQGITQAEGQRREHTKKALLAIQEELFP